MGTRTKKDTAVTHCLFTLTTILFIFCNSSIAYNISTQAISENINDLLQSARETDDNTVQSLKPFHGPARYMKKTDGYLHALSAPDFQHFPVSYAVAGDAESNARSFLSEHGIAFGVTSRDVHFMLVKIKEKAGRSYVRLEQTYAGIPVFAAETIVQLNRSGGVEYVLSDIMTDTEPLDHGQISLAPSMTAYDAAMNAIDMMMQAYPQFQFQAEAATLMIYDPSVVGCTGPVRLVWQTKVNSLPENMAYELVLVDAHDGQISLHFPLIHNVLYRKIYDANSSTTGTLRRVEGDEPVRDVPDVDLAYDFIGDAYNFYHHYHQRDSIDNAGMTLIGFVRYCTEEECPMLNAKWIGDEYNWMLFGEHFVVDDVTGHELTHGVTEYESGLLYMNESGAINESFSDMWGEWIDQTNGRGRDTPNVKWLIGEDLPFGAIRNMKSPPQGDPALPDRKRSPLWRTPVRRPDEDNDYGWVHMNCGVNNKLCYLLTDGDRFRGHTITGMGLTKIAELYYEVQTNILTQGANYKDLYFALMQAAFNLGWSDDERHNLQKACQAVEIAATELGECETIRIGYDISHLNLYTDWAEFPYPMHTSTHDGRTQVIYHADEIGRSATLTALALCVSNPPGQTLENWTIRMKHTNTQSFSLSDGFDPSGWTIVYQNDEMLFEEEGEKDSEDDNDIPPDDESKLYQWRWFVFRTPFVYNGTDNLFVDFSHNNDSSTEDGTCIASRTYSPNRRRFLCSASDSNHDDPLNWWMPETSGNDHGIEDESRNAPRIYFDNYILSIRLNICDPQQTKYPSKIPLSE